MHLTNLCGPPPPLQAFFDIFHDPSTNSLDVSSLLLYLCPSPDGQGLLRALSVLAGEDLTSNQEATVTLEALYKVNTCSATM